MAKKSRRARRQSTSRPPRRPSSSVSASRPASEAAKSLTSPGNDPAGLPVPRKLVDFSAEYHYVINDLRTMGVIAVAMLVVLVALSFVIR